MVNNDNFSSYIFKTQRFKTSLLQLLPPLENTILKPRTEKFALSDTITQNKNCSFSVMVTIYEIAFLILKNNFSEYFLSCFCN